MMHSLAEFSPVWEYESQVTRAVVEQLATHWTDATLTEQDDMYGEQWPRGTTLDVLIRHQAHHRGQLTILMRQAGLPVSGVYGPTREEWVSFGMDAPPV